MRGRGRRALVEQAAPTPPGSEIPLPGLENVQSAAGRAACRTRRADRGALPRERAAGRVRPGKERLLRVIGGHLAAGARGAARQDRGRAPRQLRGATAPPAGAAIAVVYYQADDSVFVDGAYVVKGVPGRILWKLLSEHAADGRTRSPTASSGSTSASGSGRQRQPRGATARPAQAARRRRLRDRARAGRPRPARAPAGAARALRGADQRADAALRTAAGRVRTF